MRGTRSSIGALRLTPSLITSLLVSCGRDHAVRALLARRILWFPAASWLDDRDQLAGRVPGRWLSC